ncbi:phenylalanine--tRNA ligase subunit alpha [Rickettsia endosymbiont of Cardiosporidium cionae]|uniref:phenylalanine--tRNA ligase subunit alpha n=1 Tax=Rickettsia endosymbiont of Cardiosporidium cionae TaxID=2777155 RepID=UPI001895DC09|nr:phenylalanine--tRNA ligase subunit alpha [Rickettsia endosymbiont of Cardiosporidium cionae]KAF8818458.1 phenylalanine--tRNA ligase subunit alpha [Rickettsia endosymbiont of Cardiosporidium cionae]
MKLIEKILTEAKVNIKKIKNQSDLGKLKSDLLGKNGQLAGEMKKLSSMDELVRKTQGKKLNDIKIEIEKLILERREILEREKLSETLSKQKLDLTIPEKEYNIGNLHPLTKTMEEVSVFFQQNGFVLKDGPNIENNWYNFSALNMSDTHPARQTHDSFYLNTSDINSDKAKLLRTHTSPVQIRTMEQSDPPYRFISIGKTYRADSDKTHTPMFHQIEGVVVDSNINMGHLKNLMLEFIKYFFNKNDIDIRLRPSFFPFTEPSAEIDIKINKSEEWLEILGCGMIHTTVLKNVNVNPLQYRGFAFGMGLERITMIKYNIDDLREFFNGDIRWIKHYGVSPFQI